MLSDVWRIIFVVHLIQRMAVIYRTSLFHLWLQSDIAKVKYWGTLYSIPSHSQSELACSMLFSHHHSILCPAMIFFVVQYLWSHRSAVNSICRFFQIQFSRVSYLKDKMRSSELLEFWLQCLDTSESQSSEELCTCGKPMWVIIANRASLSHIYGVACYLCSASSLWCA